MNVWIANPFDNLPPEGMRPQRYWLMARAFAAAGHRVAYWSADFSHAHKRPRDRAMEGEYDGGIRLRLSREPAYPRNICLKRLWSHWRFSRAWLRDATEEAGRQDGAARPDVLIVSSPPLSLGAAARAFCRRTGAKLVVDIQDAWPETFRRVVPGFLLAPLEVAARRNVLAADAVTAVSEVYLEMARKRGAKCPMHLCRHGIDLAAAAPDPAASPKERDPGVFRLAYAGNMSRSYDLATAVRAVIAMPDLSLDLAGTGPDEPALRNLAAGCERIRFHGYLGETGLRNLLSACDAGVVPMFGDSLVQVPGKLADYAAAALPVVYSLGGETDGLLSHHGAGCRYEAGDMESFAAAVRKIRGVPKSAAQALAVEFDAAKLYNLYVRFIAEQVKK